MHRFISNGHDLNSQHSTRVQNSNIKMDYLATPKNIYNGNINRKGSMKTIFFCVCCVVSDRYYVVNTFVLTIHEPQCTPSDLSLIYKVVLEFKFFFFDCFRLSYSGNEDYYGVIRYYIFRFIVAKITMICVYRQHSSRIL